MWNVDAPCLTDDTVLDFVAGRLADPERARAERHLGACLLCNRLVAVAAGYQNVGPANDLTAATDDGRAAREPARGSSLPLGTELRDTYRLARLVGRGGMGEVFEATHARLPGRFAVKVLHPHCVADPKAIVRFRREAEITSGLRHPNIVAIIDFDYTPAGAPYLVMEYLEGGELARVIAEEAPLALERVLRIVDQIASALTAVHRRDIVHRDLKPQNVFLLRGERAGEEHVKLCDFGISKVRAASVALTGERVLLGTPQYMAPEQARGTGEVDARADQFALAAIVYEMLTGRLAFPGDRVEIVVYRISHEEPRPLGPPWGPELAAVLDRALAKDPAGRFPSVQDFATALRAAAEKDRPWGTPGVLSKTTLRSEPAPVTVTPTVTPTTIPPVSVTARGDRRAAFGRLGVGAALVLAVGAVLVVRGRTAPSARSTPDVAASTRARPASSPAPPVQTSQTAPTPTEVTAASSQGTSTKPAPATTTHGARDGHAKKPAALPTRAGDDRSPSTPVRDSKMGSLIDRL
jgi:serine/threonine protein kinase